MPAENGLPQYTSKHARSGLYQYYRRPPSGIRGAAFVRSYGSKDRKTVWAKYDAIHAEAEAYFARLVSGRTVGDDNLFQMIASIDQLEALYRDHGRYRSPEDMGGFIDQYGSPRMKALASPDRERLCLILHGVYAGTETINLELARYEAQCQAEQFKERFGAGAGTAPANAFTLKDAYDQAWVPAKTRGRNTVVEIGRYVDEFEAINGKLDLKEYTREHWSAWRADCLERHGPGPTAFKRFSMMKTICNEAIRAGLLERRHFAGQDVSMRKIKSKKLRNEGWLKDELRTWFSAPLFHGSKDSPRPDADYWIAVIIAYTGARLSEVTGMLVTDVAERHGVQTFYLAKEKGKTDDSRRIIPIPRQVMALGFNDYLATRPKSGPLFADVNAKLMSQTYGRMRADAGITRKGADVHAHRHHLKTLLSDLECPDRVSDYITGHAAPNVGRTYGKTELTTALKYLNQIDLGVSIPAWKRAKPA